MNREKKNRFFVSGLLFVLALTASINLISCGGANSGPVLYSINPGSTTAPASSGSPATTSVTLTGANFGPSASPTSNVLFNGAVSGATIWTDNTIVATVPTLPTSGLTAGTNVTSYVTVSVGGSVSNSVTFVYNITS
jgi:hypothetical protein